ncbi:MAG: phenylalanine--tRNA ligase subunit alpha [Fidelibacterota bacterium]
MSIHKQIEAVRKEFRTALEAFPTTRHEIDELKARFLGRKGKIAGLFNQLGKADPSERPAIGKLLNELRAELTSAFEERANLTVGKKDQSNTVITDYSLPGVPFRAGSVHPLQQTLDEIKAIFRDIGFSVAYGPEIDDDYHNFQALNIPKHHPARDMQDTFFVSENIVLRTHTSNVQIHLMEEEQPPIRYIVPGRVYRNEAISFKSYCLFHQVEGLYVDRNVSFAELKSTLTYFIHRMFGQKAKIRFRPSFFPFTEPSAEVDLWNEERDQWMEILGCGMVDPAVFSNVDYDPEQWQGYAFGMGVERIAMLKYRINDIRLFYQNDLRFLSQF